ncbi:50S ribosomal protein L24 [candidate division WWE3 bacterium]|nr:50S ribosomal protein L24 [candidate division WWE3 bacterium]
MKIRKDDKIKVIKGKDAGKQGKVLAINTNSSRVLVEGINIVKRHVKPGAVSKEGGIISIERSISLANVMLICPKCSAATRTEFKVMDNKKFRVCKKCKEVLKK